MAEVVVDDVHMAHRINALTSTIGLLVGLMLLIVSVQQYRSGASALWAAAGAAIFLITSYTFVRDVRRLRAGRTA